jgi:VWFA-related protein
MARLATGLLVVALSVTLTGQQAPAPTFKTDVNAVVVDFRVVDAQGRFVGDLTKDDVQIFEDGKPQTVTTFDHVNIPIHEDERPLFAGQPVDADVVSNAGAGPNAGVDGRLYVLLLDDLHTIPARSANVRAQAREFLEHHFTETDRAVVLTTSGRQKVVQEFTNNRQRLLHAVDQFEGGFQTASRCGMLANGNTTVGGRGALMPLNVADSANCAITDDRTAWDALSAVATWLGTISGKRKAVLFFSEGFAGQMAHALGSTGADPNPLDAYNGPMNSLTGADAAANGETIYGEQREAGGSAARANVSVYPLDSRANPTALFTRVVTDSSSYYLLGYVPTNDTHDGTFRRLEVRTVRPGLTVQARTGYTARNDTSAKHPPGAAPSPVLTELMAMPVQTPGLTMSVAAPSFLGKGSKASVEVIVDVAGRDLMATSDAAAGKGTLELLVAVADADGHVKATEHGSLDMQLSTATRDAIAEHGLRVISRLDVPPGRYLLRIAGVDGGGNTKGSLQYDLDVPDFSSGALTMSSVALASASELRRPTTGSDKAWKQRFPAPPTASRVFSVGEEISISGEIYSNEKQTGAIEVTTTVTRASGEVVFRHQEMLTGGSGKPATFRHQTTMSLGAIGAGTYLLRVEARNPANAKATASRQFPFTVQ